MVQHLHWKGAGDKPWSALQLVTSAIVARGRSPSLQAIVAAIANARNEAPAPAAAPDHGDENPELIRAWFEQAVALMEHGKQRGSTDRSRASIDEARNLLTRAVRVARLHLGERGECLGLVPTGAQLHVRRSLPSETFRVILCRNLAFTYFAEPLQQQTLEGICTRLSDGGALVLGRHEQLPPTTLLGPWIPALGIHRHEWPDRRHGEGWGDTVG